MSPSRHDKIEVGRIDKEGFEDKDTADNIGCSLCIGAVPSGDSAGVPVWYLCRPAEDCLCDSDGAGYHVDY
ncbi:hypothetical protein [Holdemanella biformis]|uniref:hypothetical protein n=1 Tax=Holdemanella biformis TaxID=1735 RepID=UPI00242EA620|nr:hypothetical protein [Holdemanella biformis]MBS6258798.1 hypothetical protein [Holdemanella biformis]